MVEFSRLKTGPTYVCGVAGTYTACCVHSMLRSTLRNMSSWAPMAGVITDVQSQEAELQYQEA